MISLDWFSLTFLHVLAFKNAQMSGLKKTSCLSLTIWGITYRSQCDILVLVSGHSQTPVYIPKQASGAVLLTKQGHC